MLEGRQDGTNAVRTPQGNEKWTKCLLYGLLYTYKREQLLGIEDIMVLNCRKSIILKFSTVGITCLLLEKRVSSKERLFLPSLSVHT